ncbi:unnamed protein product [Rangifer tarandus platyrhynchus]|uniref:Uncharacterized protein n=2 Tax=Rangifer tarandus platyrhynchus TaxID=3082113 RepID=A0ACB0F1T3_RANTA|nr:unnamed protein product [Rangifer tarandus platyrhynchus]CAI9707078.1 unnamed protein product [Rangifer tarandus platyrhynchus]
MRALTVCRFSPRSDAGAHALLRACTARTHCGCPVCRGEAGAQEGSVLSTHVQPGADPGPSLLSLRPPGRPRQPLEQEEQEIRDVAPDQRWRGLQPPRLPGLRTGDGLIRGK